MTRSNYPDLSTRMGILLAMSLVLATGWAQQKVYKHVDENGKVVYSDEPLNDSAEEVKLKPLSVVQIDKLAGTIPPSTAAVAEEPPNLGYKYDVFRIASPGDKSTLTGSQQSVTASLEIFPELRDQHMIRYFYDGLPVATVKSTTYRFSDVFRGEHTLGAAVIDGAGQLVQSAPTITIYNQQARTGNDGLLGPSDNPNDASNGINNNVNPAQPAGLSGPSNPRPVGGKSGGNNNGGGTP